jgi:uroporphyrinogen-III synthase
MEVLMGKSYVPEVVFQPAMFDYQNVEQPETNHLAYKVNLQECMTFAFASSEVAKYYFNHGCKTLL